MALQLAIAARNDGVLIVDEIENGFYHERLPSIWKGLYESCDKHQVQLFATTHSMECLRALLPTLKGHEGDFRLIRMKREGNQSVAKIINGDSLEAALEGDVELR
jgi:AAA15 family ATPase/GTPase